MKTKTSWHQFVECPLWVVCTISKIELQLLNANWWVSASDCTQWHRLLLRQTIQGIELRTETDWKKFEIERWCSRDLNTAYDTADGLRYSLKLLTILHCGDLRCHRLLTILTKVGYDATDSVHHCRKGLFLNFVTSSRRSQAFLLLLLHGNSRHNVFGSLWTHRPAEGACSS